MCWELSHVRSRLQVRNLKYYLLKVLSQAFVILCINYRRSKSDKVELSYITPSNVILKVVESGKTANIRSKYGSEISEVQLMGKDLFAVARTVETIIICEKCYYKNHK